MSINFGTDGWRAVISDTFTFHNLRMITQAIADGELMKCWYEYQTVVDNNQGEFLN